MRKLSDRRAARRAKKQRTNDLCAEADQRLGSRLDDADAHAAYLDRIADEALIAILRQIAADTGMELRDL